MITEQQTIWGWQLHYPDRPSLSSALLGFQVGQQAALQSLFLQQQFSNGFTFKKLQAGPEKQKKRFEIQHQLNRFLRYNKDWGAKWGCYIPTYCWQGRLWTGLLGTSELMPLQVRDRRYWCVRCQSGHEWARSQMDLLVVWQPRWWPIPEKDQAV